MRHRVVLFDLDETLLTSGGAGRRALERAVREVAGVAAPLDIVPYAGRTDPAILRDLLTALGLAATADRMAAIFERYVARLDEEMGRGSSGRLLPGAAETIAALSGRPGVHPGVLTGNIAAGARIKMRPFGLVERLPFGAFGDDAPERPDLLPIALERWRAWMGNGCGPACDMRDVYVVGDTVHDVAVARAWGARAVAVGTGRRQPRQALLEARPDFFFEDLAAAAPLIEEVAGGA